jgi:hypothetical protein
MRVSKRQHCKQIEGDTDRKWVLQETDYRKLLFIRSSRA